MLFIFLVVVYNKQGEVIFMGDRAKNKEQPTQETKEEKQQLGYGNWLFRKEGTAAEPWPTAEELWKNPEVKSAIDAHNKSVKKRNGTK